MEPLSEGMTNPSYTPQRRIFRFRSDGRRRGKANSTPAALVLAATCTAPLSMLVLLARGATGDMRPGRVCPSSTAYQGLCLGVQLSPATRVQSAYVEVMSCVERLLPAFLLCFARRYLPVLLLEPTTCSYTLKGTAAVLHVSRINMTCLHRH